MASRVGAFNPFRRNPNRPFPWVALAVLVSLVVAWEVYSYRHARGDGAPGEGGAARLDGRRKSPGAWGRAGDLVLTSPGGAALTFVAAPDRPGRRPLVGALVDVTAEPGDVADPLRFLRQVVVEQTRVRSYPFRYPQAVRCNGGRRGVRAGSTVGEGLSTEVCVTDGSRFRLTTSGQSISHSAWIVDELEVGPLPIVVDRVGGDWGTEASTRFLAFAAAGTAVLIEAPRMRVTRAPGPIGAAPVLVRYGPEATIQRTLVVARGDVLSAVAEVQGATRVVQVTFGPGRGGEVAVLGDGGRVLATGAVAPSEVRHLRLPQGFGTHLELRDSDGVVTDASIGLPPPGKLLSVSASVPEAATLEVSYRGEEGAPLPVRIVVEGLGGTDAPTLRGVDPRVAYEGPSVSALDGSASLRVRPGRYRVTAAHGITHTTFVQEVDVSAGGSATVQGVLRRAVDTRGWMATDPHVATPMGTGGPSPAERAILLVASGIELAVATDHDWVAELGAAARSLGVDDRLVTLSGVAITSADEPLGHFGAFPLELGARDPGDTVPEHHARRPEETFRSARDLGARVVAVFQPRTEVAAGYLDRVRFDPSTGRADPIFSGRFDALEVMSGESLATRDRVRRGVSDLVGLARRGASVAAIGGSGTRGALPLAPGYPRTFIHVGPQPQPAASRAERALSGLLARATTVSSGPFVELRVDGHGPGEVVVPSSSTVRVHLRVSAPAWVPLDHVELLRDGVVLERFSVTGSPVDGARFERELEVSFEGRDCVLHAWAEGDTPLPDFVPGTQARSIGFTGLTWVDGDRDGRAIVPAEPAVAR